MPAVTAPPLLSPKDRRGAAAAVAAIARALARPPPPLDGDADLATALLSREPGFTLFYAYLDRAQPNAAWRRHGVRHLERAVARIPNQSYKPFFSYGFSGTAWAVQHLAGWFLDVPDDMTSDIDDALLTLVDEAPTLSYDLQYGLVGFGIYAVERLPHPAGRKLLEGIIERLARAAEPRGRGLSFRSVNADWVVGAGIAEALAKGVYATNTINGVAGVVGICGAAIRHGVAVRRARRLLDGALRWLWSRRGRDGLFPSHAQLTWSHGSLGIAAVTHAAARAAGLPVWERRALDLARRVARLRGSRAVLRGASLGSGAAGAAHLFHRLAVESGDQQLAAAARRWAQRLVRRRRPGTGIAGYRTAYIPAAERRYLGDLRHPVGWLGTPGLIDGAAGIGLVLLALLHGHAPWDRALLLSHR
jgi:hypothetical protein